MKKVETKNIVVGETYFDCESMMISTELKLVRKTEELLIFELISGQNSYLKRKDGTIVFSVEEACFYQ